MKIYSSTHTLDEGIRIQTPREAVRFATDHPEFYSPDNIEYAFCFLLDQEGYLRNSFLTKGSFRKLQTPSRDDPELREACADPIATQLYRLHSHPRNGVGEPSDGDHQNVSGWREFADSFQLEMTSVVFNINGLKSRYSTYDETTASRPRPWMAAGPVSRFFEEFAALLDRLP